ncbi:MAG: hypothetical protein ACI83I_001139 [Bacteroidia bacterium]|jgi:hypothetical protein
MSKRILHFCFVVFLLQIVLITSCKNDDVFTTDSSAKLKLQEDTVYFDTVFTYLGNGVPLSATKIFTVVNPNKESIRTDVYLGGGDQSYFSLNVDGEAGRAVNGIEILPGDSIFVFVEVNLDPNQDPAARPLVIKDSLIFKTNGNLQDVKLIAWGQDAHYMLNDTLCNVVLDDKEKPYVVHGYLFVPENCKLTIKEGVKMYFGARTWLYVEGTLDVQGSISEPVYMEADRLEPDYEERAGQWGGVWLNYLSTNNTISYARIKNGTVGIYCDSSSKNDLPNVVIKNTEVRNMSFDGLSGKRSYIRSENSVYDNCGRYSCLALWGGRYELYHNTFITYNYYFGRKDPTFLLNNFEADEFGRVLRTFKIEVDARNNIIYGSLAEEVGLGLLNENDDVKSFIFTNNLLKTEQPNLAKGDFKNILNIDPLFKDYRNYDYHIIEGSGAIDIGLNLGITNDLEGTVRDAKPDAGALEYLP